MNDCNCEEPYNGTDVRNWTCRCYTSTPALQWKLATSNCRIDLKFSASSKNSCNKCPCTNKTRIENCTDNAIQNLQVCYNYTMNTSNVSFIVNKTEEVHIICLNGQGPYKENCTVKDPGIVKLSVVYSLHIETLT